MNIYLFLITLYNTIIKLAYFIKNSNYLEYLYDIRFYIRSLISPVININNEYNNNIKIQPMQNLKSVFNFFKVKYDKTEEEL